jgi:hyperosmotically inducible protein
MKRVLLAAALGASLTVGNAQASVERKNLQLFTDVATAVTTYNRYSIFDDVNIAVRDGIVTLTGRVMNPIKKEELEKRVSKVDGVLGVKDDLSVLPLSPTDDQLRHRIARAIYRNENFTQYANQAVGPIHIIVENGRVMLTGVVASDMDRVLAGMAAHQFPAFSVTNRLKTDAEVKAERERL